MAEDKRYIIETEDGFTVRVPDDKLGSWQKGQQEVRDGSYTPSAHEIDRVMALLEKLGGAAAAQEGGDGRVR